MLQMGAKIMTVDHCAHTRAQSFEGGAVVLVHPLISIFEQQADGCGSSVKLIDLQSLNHLPVASCEKQDTPE